MMKNFVSILLLLALASTAHAQISVPNTFVTGTPALASEVNANFDALESNALNRTGGTITGNIAVDSGVTIDGIDVGGMLGGLGNGSFATLAVSGAVTLSSTLAVTGTTTLSGSLVVAGTTSIGSITSGGPAIFNSTVALNSTVDVAGALIAGSGNVTIIDSTGKIPALTSTYLTDVSGTSLTGLAKLASANTFSARNNFLSYSETYSAPAISGGSLTIDASAGSFAIIALNQNITSFTISNVEAAPKVTAISILFYGGTGSIVWPVTTRWPSGLAPTMSGSYNWVTLVTHDGGTSWWGFIGGNAFA